MVAALSRAFDHPSVYTRVDGLAGLPNVSEVISTASGVLALLSVQHFVYLSLVPHRVQLRVVSLVASGAVLSAMVGLFLASGPIRQPIDPHAYPAMPGTIVAYRSVYLGYFMIFAWVLTAVLARYAFAGEDAQFRWWLGESPGRPWSRRSSTPSRRSFSASGQTPALAALRDNPHTTRIRGWWDTRMAAPRSSDPGTASRGWRSRS